MSSKINLQTCEYARKSSIFQDNQLILVKYVGKIIPSHIERDSTCLTAVKNTFFALLFPNQKRAYGFLHTLYKKLIIKYTSVSTTKYFYLMKLKFIIFYQVIPQSLLLQMQPPNTVQ